MANIKVERKNNFRIEYTKGDTYALKLKFNNISEDLTSAFFTVKENTEDETPLIEKTIGSGISKLDENFYRDQIVYKLQLQAEDSRNLEADHLYLYDLKIAVGNVIKTVIKGNFVVTYNVTGVDRITTALAEIDVDDVIETDAETVPATQGIEYEQDPVAMAKIGDITQLNTTAKNTLVDAINETNTKASSAHEEITNIENGTVTVPEATHATSADNATSANNAANSSAVNNIELVKDENGVLKIGDVIIPQKKLLWEGTAVGDDSISTDFIIINNLLGTFSSGDKILVKGVYDWVVNNTVRESFPFEYIFFQGSDRCTPINYINFPNGNHGVPSIVTSLNNQIISLSRYLVYFAGDGTTSVGNILNSLKITEIYKFIE